MPENANGSNGFLVGGGGGSGPGWRDLAAVGALAQPVGSFRWIHPGGEMNSLRDLYFNGNAVTAIDSYINAYVGDDATKVDQARNEIAESIRRARNRLAFLEAAKEIHDGKIAELDKAKQADRLAEVEALCDSIREVWINDPSPMAGDRIHRVAEHVQTLIEAAKAGKDGAK
jgi:hypothetical protein